MTKVCTKRSNKLWAVFFLAGFVLTAVNTASYADYKTDLLAGVNLVDIDTSDGDAFVGTVGSDGYGVPVVYDWNNDGKKDILLALALLDDKGDDNPRGDGGYIRYYKNYGTNDAPTFNGYVLLESCDSGGNNCVVIMEDVSCCHHISHSITDWDEDGNVDILAGINNPHSIVYYKNLGTTYSSGALEGTPKLQNYQTILTTDQTKPMPVVYDWDKDDAKDLIVGEEFGYIYIFLNVGTSSSPSFTGASSTLKVNGEAVKVGSDSSPFIADWDGDGKDDMLIGGGSDRVVYYLGNEADTADEQPVFNSYEVMKLADGTNLRSGSNYKPRVFVDDWNEDGRNDVLLSANWARVTVCTDGSRSLTVNIPIEGSGTVTDAGTDINCPDDCLETYAPLVNDVTLTATSSTGYTFSRWVGCDTPSANQCAQSVSSSETVTASFIPASVDKSVAFGRVDIGLNAQIPLTITNNGSSTDLLVGAVSNDEDLSSSFSITGAGNCENQTLGPAPAATSTCTITVGFSPTTAGLFRDSFTIGDGAITIALTGEGISGGVASDPDITVFPTNMNDFLNTATSTVQYATSTIYNFGGGELDIDQITVSNTDRYSVPGGSDNCSNSTVSVSATCTVAVMYTALPAAAGGPHMATLSIPSNDPDEETVLSGLIGSTIAAGNTEAPTQPSGASPANGATVGGTTVTWTDAVDSQTSVEHTRYIGTDPSLATSTLLAAADAEELGNRGVRYAGYAGYPAVLIGIVAAGGISRKRKRIGLFMAAVIITGGLLFNSCGGGGGGGGSISANLATGATAAGGTTYYWKVVADDGNGGVNESDVYSFTTQ